MEEQFYLGLPAVLLCTVLAVRARRRRPGASTGTQRRTIAGVLFVTTAASLAWSVYASHVSPHTAYFSTLTRIWEFGAGGLLAVVAPVVAARLRTAHRNLRCCWLAPVSRAASP